MRFSVRTQLVLLTTGVVLVILGIVAFGVDFGTRQAVFQSIDRDLSRRTAEFARRPHNHPERARMPFPPYGPPPREGFEGRRQPPFFVMIPSEPSADPGRPTPVPLDAQGAALVRGGGKVIRTVSSSSGLLRVASQGVLEDDVVVGVVQAGAPVDDIVASLAQLRLILLTLVLPLGTVLAALGSLLVVRQVLAPVGKITQEASAIQGTDLKRRIEGGGNDEFGHLATTINGMLARIDESFTTERETNQRLREAMERQKRFTADASHEIKTPLAVIKAHASLLREGGGGRDSVEAIESAANRMNKLVVGLLALAKADSGPVEAFVPVFSKSLLLELSHSFAHEKGRIRFASDPSDPAFLGSFDEAFRALLNLVQNSLHHGGPGEVRVTVKATDDLVLFVVEDDGPGIPPADLPHLFERFYRADQSRSVATGGTGLGLAITQAIAERHGGKVTAANGAKGAIFTLSFPRWHQPSPSEA